MPSVSFAQSKRSVSIESSRSASLTYACSFTNTSNITIAKETFRDWTTSSCNDPHLRSAGEADVRRTGASGRTSGAVSYYRDGSRMRGRLAIRTIPGPMSFTAAAAFAPASRGLPRPRARPPDEAPRSPGASPARHSPRRTRFGPPRGFVPGSPSAPGVCPSGHPLPALSDPESTEPRLHSNARGCGRPSGSAADRRGRCRSDPDAKRASARLAAFRRAPASCGATAPLPAAVLRPLPGPSA